MPDDIKISALTNVPTLDDSAVFPMVQEINGVMTTLKSSMSQMAGKVAEGTTFVNLKTTDKTPVGAINEVNGTWLTGTLTAGQTSLTLSDASITTSSTIDYYTDAFGVSPTNVVVTTGQIVLTFPAQAADLGVKVRVL
jgi:hypothetical protein